MLRLSTEVILVVRGAHIYQNDNSIIIASLPTTAFFNVYEKLESVEIVILMTPRL